MTLIIVESPTKARTFNRILKGAKTKEEYYVFATVGHIRDLPSKKISIDYTKDFKPTYEVIAKKKKVVMKLKELASKNKEIILATDLDREGESISYHIAYLLGFVKEKWPESTVDVAHLKRIVFHEITPKALFAALKEPSELRMNLVKAQQARRILDRIVGYELSPLLWKKTGRNWLSAGRVQTVALRFIVEREKEIRAFGKEPYYQIYGVFNPSAHSTGSVQASSGQETGLKAKLVAKDDVLYEQKSTLQLFAGEYTYTKTTISKDTIEALVKDAQKDAYTISDIKEDVVTRTPPPPFTTSLLQQEGFQKLHFASSHVMRLAQNLYEQGLITYHRTDSFSLASSFVFGARDYITATYGKEYALEKPRGYSARSRLAQEAHEAIRPTHVDQDTSALFKKRKLTADHRRLYELIFTRAVATQMKEAQIRKVVVQIMGKKGYLFESEHQKVLFDGFLRVLNPEFVAKHTSDHGLAKDEKLALVDLSSEELETKPPWRYHEASLIRVLEEKGIGRPSTYAMIISLIQNKGYVEKEYRYFKPTNLGEAICDYLSSTFPDVFDVGFTSSLEEGLDKIAQGEDNIVSVLRTFYTPFKATLDARATDTTTMQIKEETDEKCPKCGSPLVMRRSKFGKFLACSSYPKCKFTKSQNVLVKDKKCPKCGGGVVVKYTKSKKRFFGCENYPKCDFASWAYNKI